MIKNLPAEENPREKAVTYGIETLTNVELLAILLRTGNKQESVMVLAQNLLYEVGGMNGFNHIDYARLMRIKGIKKAKSLEILASIELGKRIIESTHTSIDMHNPQMIYNHLKGRMMSFTQEHFIILILDTKYQLIKEKTLFVGLVNMSLVSTRDIFKEVLSVNGVYIIAVHNHPSGDSTPSSEDRRLTKQLEESGKLMDVALVDHIIIGKHQYFSFQGNKIFYD